MVRLASLLLFIKEIFTCSRDIPTLWLVMFACPLTPVRIEIFGIAVGFAIVIVAVLFCDIWAPWGSVLRFGALDIAGLVCHVFRYSGLIWISFWFRTRRAQLLLALVVYYVERFPIPACQFKEDPPLFLLRPTYLAFAKVFDLRFRFGALPVTFWRFASVRDWFGMPWNIILSCMVAYVDLARLISYLSSWWGISHRPTSRACGVGCSI